MKPSLFPILATCTAHLNLLDLITLTILGEEVLLNACKDIGLVVNTGKTKYMEIGRHRGMIANAHIKISSNSYDKVNTFKYLGSLFTNQNSIQEEIKCRLKAGNSCYYSVQHTSF